MQGRVHCVRGGRAHVDWTGAALLRHRRVARVLRVSVGSSGFRLRDSEMHRAGGRHFSPIVSRAGALCASIGFRRISFESHPAT